MTQEHALRAYKHYKDLLENPKYANQKQVWKNNIKHGMESIREKYLNKKNPVDFEKIISEEKEEEKTKKKKEK